MVDSVLATGLNGVQAGILRAHQAASSIAGQTLPREGVAPADNLIQPMVELELSEQQVVASAAVVKTADELLGTLIDIKA